MLLHFAAGNATLTNTSADFIGRSVCQRCVTRSEVKQHCRDFSCNLLSMAVGLALGLGLDPDLGLVLGQGLGLGLRLGRGVGVVWVWF